MGQESYLIESRVGEKTGTHVTTARGWKNSWFFYILYTLYSAFFCFQSRLRRWKSLRFLSKNNDTTTTTTTTNDDDDDNNNNNDTTTTATTTTTTNDDEGVTGWLSG